LFSSLPPISTLNLLLDLIFDRRSLITPCKLRWTRFCVRAESTALSPFRYFFSPLVGGLVFCVRRMRRKHCLSTAGVITTRKVVDQVSAYARRKHCVSPNSAIFLARQKKYRPYYDVIGHPQQQQQQQQQHIITTPHIALQPSYYLIFLNDLSALHITYHSITGPSLCPNVRINHFFKLKSLV
jgi:hypothetical protein